jgi:transposase
MRPKGSAEVLEDRRRRALALLERRLSLNEVARALGCAPSSVMRWRNAFQQRGPEALKVRSTPGRPPKLTVRQRQRLDTILRQGAMAHGYRTKLWTTTRIAELIQRVFGVQYHRDHVGRLMHALGWSCEKREARAGQREKCRIGERKRRDGSRGSKTRRGWRPLSRFHRSRFDVE